MRVKESRFFHAGHPQINPITQIVALRDEWVSSMCYEEAGKRVNGKQGSSVKSEQAHSR
jgi:hypothetical protein